jgi:hypothetical protein
MLPDRCSVKEKGTDCVNPPKFVISVIAGTDEFMVGVTCQKHKESVSDKVESLQDQDKIPNGKIKFTKLQEVGTDCIRADPEDFIQL